MLLADTLKQNMKAAMKAKDSATLSTLRLLISAVKNKQIELRHELSNEEIRAIIKTQVKQLKDSIESFTIGGRNDLAQSARVEIKVLKKYLPEEMGDDELEKVIAGVIGRTGASGKADFGKVMGTSMKVVAGRADGSRVKEIVARLLGVFILVVGVGAIALNAHAAVPFVENFSSASNYFVFMLRVVRVLMLWLGIAAVSMILSGGFSYMTASMRDDIHTQALTKITHGVFISLIVAAMFAFVTIILQQVR